jgi:hypothetical protein
MMLGISTARGTWLVLTALIAGSSAACDNDPTYPDDMAVFEIEVAGGERFHIGLTQSAEIARASALLASGAENNVHGTLRRGDGGFNSPYTWHLEPGSVTFPDLSMEVCDGRPQSDVQSDVSYWVDTVRYYCPWGVRVVGRVNRS